MRLIRGIYNILPSHRGCVLAIGNFDGVHLGHQALLKHLIEEGKKRNLPTVVMIFEPQPLEFFAQDKAPIRITRFRDKVQQIQAAGIDYLLCVKFNKAFAQMTAEQFITTLLVHKLGVQYVLSGEDFCFGRQRQGNLAMLQAAAKQYGFTAEVAPTLTVSDHRVSSTAVREALQQSDFERVTELLGRPYTISGRIVYGQQLGRTLGFPTANMQLDGKTAPLKGVFAVKATIDGQTHFGVANMGFRPTVAGRAFLLEVHLFHINANLYGKQMSVEVCHKIRDEQKFGSLDALKAQIQHDAEATKQFFNINH